jgi:hypothetical protein
MLVASGPAATRCLTPEALPQRELHEGQRRADLPGQSVVAFRSPDGLQNRWGVSQSEGRKDEIVTSDKDFKKVVRERAAKTGESYSTARSNLASEPNADMKVVRDQFVGLVRFFWSGFRPQLRGLTDDEYLWEPVAGCPNVRGGEDGTWRADHQFPVKGAASIGQRLCWAAHLIEVDLSQHYGDKSVTMTERRAVPGDATGGVRYLESSVENWMAAVEACDPARLLEHSQNLSPGSIDHQFPLVATLIFKYQLLVECCSQVSATRDWYLAAHPNMVGPN